MSSLRCLLPMFGILLASCAAEKNEDDAEVQAPLRSGIWRISIEELLSNSCPDEDDDFGVGTSETSQLSSTSSSVVFYDDEGNEAHSMDINGDTFSDSGSELIEVQDPCFIRATFDYNGEIVGYEYFDAVIDMALGTEGDCSGVNTTGFPCSYSLRLSGEWVGES